jgi:hypothetical protein
MEDILYGDSHGKFFISYASLLIAISNNYSTPTSASVSTEYTAPTRNVIGRDAPGEVASALAKAVAREVT